MRKRMQWLCLCLGLLAALPAGAQISGIGDTPPFSPSGSLSSSVQPPALVGSGGARAVNPVAFLDEVRDTGTSESLFHLSVYADGHVNVAVGRFSGSAIVSEDVDFTEVDPETVQRLQQALLASGVERLSGSLPGPDGRATHSDSFTHVTVFRRPSRRSRTITANSFRFAPEVQNAAARRAATLLKEFAQDVFPGLVIP
jgi:hypothetical protein